MTTVHTLPLNDLREHDEHDDCWCGPDIFYIEGAGKHALHHSLDGREHNEPDHDRADCPLCSSGVGGTPQA